MICSLGDINNIYHNLITADYRYLLIILGLLAIYLILWPLSLALIIKSEEPKVKFKRDYEIAATEFFFNGITPFSSGGQPFQVYSMSGHLLYSYKVIKDDPLNAFAIIAIVLGVIAVGAIIGITIALRKRQKVK